MTDVINALTNWLKTHPLVSFIFALAPVFGIALGISNTFYQSTIDEYRSQIDTLNLNRSLVSFVPNNEVSSSDNQNVNSFRNLESQKSTRPAIENLYLYEGTSKLIWDGKVKVVFTKMITTPRAVNITLFLRGFKQDFILYPDNREIFSFEDRDYFIDLLSTETTISRAEIAIVPESITIVKCKVAPCIGYSRQY
jgi:hypothetical protein